MKNRALWTIQVFAASLAAFVASPAVCQTRPPVDQDAAKSLIEDALASKNPETRRQAVAAMALLAGQPQFQRRLESMLQDRDVNVRLAAIASVSLHPSDRAAEALRGALADRVPEVSFSAAKALFVLNDPAGKQALIAILDGDGKTSSGIVAERKREAVRMLHDPKKLTVFAATKSVWLAPVPGVGFGVASVQQTLSHKRDSGRAVTAMLLETDPDPAVVAALRHALADKDASVRAAAVEAIALGNDPGMQENVVPMLRDRKREVRLWAAACYLRLQALKDRQPAPAQG
jgi:HEAT repeat protein